MRDHTHHHDVVIVSMQSSPSAWHAPTEINGKTCNFLIDYGTSKSVISKEFYNDLPNIQHTNIKFCLANGSLNKAAGVCHLPVTFKFGTVVKTLDVHIIVMQ